MANNAKAKKAEDVYIHSRKAPLFKTTMGLLNKIDDILLFLEKNRRYTIGQHMLDSVLGMLSCVSMAYDFPDTRKDELKKYIIEYHKLASLLKLLQDKGYLDYKNKNYYVELIEPLGNAYTQAKAWFGATIENARICDGTTESV